MEECAEDSTLELATKTWNRAVSSAAKLAYREGREDGSMSVFQNGFDKGYQIGFKTAFILGKFKGLSSFLPGDHPQEIQEILKNTRKGECAACVEESKGTKGKDLTKKTINEVIECQEKHFALITNKLNNYFEPLLKSKEICTNFLINDR